MFFRALLPAVFLVNFTGVAFAQPYAPQFQIKAPANGLTWNPGNTTFYAEGLYPYPTTEGQSILNDIDGTCQPTKGGAYNPGPTPAQYKAGKTQGCEIFIIGAPYNSPAMFSLFEPSDVDMYSYAATEYDGATSDGAQQFACLYEVTLQWNQSAALPTTPLAGTCRMSVSANVLYLPEGGVRLPNHSAQCIAGTNSNVVSQTSNGNGCNGLVLSVTPVTTP